MPALVISLRQRIRRGARGSVAAAAALALGLSLADAWGPARTEPNSIGVLTCNLSEPLDQAAGGSSAAQVRQVLCIFKKDGTQETYVGKAQVANLPANEKGTLLWLVKASATVPVPPGFLQQSYSGDPATPAGQIPDMIGKANSGVVLQTMSDRKAGSAGAKDKAPAPGIIVIEIELNLKSTTS